MANEDRFKQGVIATLAKRAANRCSNPDCHAITSGPSVDPQDFVNVGEAAHIYGAHPGSARFDAAMISADRSAISNGIWLCASCHKKVDDDPGRYPVGLLFEWQREHERTIAEQVGKTSAETRQRYEKRHLEEFGRLSYLAERTLIEKDSQWEYRLTAEVLRYEMAPVLQRWSALRRRLYLKQNSRIEKEEFFPWLSTRIGEISAISNAFSELINVEFARAWGLPGVAGDEADIISTCRLYSEVCQSALLWEETVRFIYVDEVFTEVRQLFTGVAGGIIDEAAKLPVFLSETLTSGPDGVHKLSLSVSLPDGWVAAVEAAFKRSTRSIKWMNR
jgi:hypothetical protein